MPVKTTKEREEELKDSSPKIKLKESEKDEGEKKIKMYLPQITVKGKYTLILNYKGKKEEIQSKNGIVEVSKNEIDKYKSCGFKRGESKPKNFYWYYCSEYSNKSFNLILDDGTKISIDKGLAYPKNKYQESQLIKNHFKIYKLKK